MIGNDLKLTAEEIELGLVKPNASIAALHIKLLKVRLFFIQVNLSYHTLVLMLDLDHVRVL